MKTELNTFFSTTVPSALEELQADTKSHWGKMTAPQMLTHLIQSSNMIHLENPKLIIKEKYIEKAIAFLYTDKPLAKGTEVPKNLGYHFDNEIIGDIEVIKIKLITSTQAMLTFLSKNTDFKAIHPFFGELNSQQWLLFQKKHFSHHLSQFGLL